MRNEAFRVVIAVVMVLAILYGPPAVARPDPPPAAAACIVACIGIACGVVIVYGLYRMCEQIPAPGQDPPYGAPLSEVPGMGPPSHMRPLPPLWLQNQLASARVSVQHQDSGGDWQTDYSFEQTDSQIGGVAMVAYDSNGVPLLTNDVPIVNYSGQNYAPFMFTNLPALPSNSETRMFRLIAQ